jgi:hypothetical protein
LAVGGGKCHAITIILGLCPKTSMRGNTQPWTWLTQKRKKRGGDDPNKKYIKRTNTENFKSKIFQEQTKLQRV